MVQTHTSNGGPEALADPYAWIHGDLEAIRRAGWERTLRPASAALGPQVVLGGRTVLQFASNDYLGLSVDPRLAAAAIAAIGSLGCGATGSRLTGGDREVHHALERALAEWKGAQDCLVFSSGFLANLGVIPALVGKKDLILSDRYNHASLRSGAELSGASRRVYPHADAEALAALLEAERRHHRRCLICTDGVFSMDGDLAPLPRLVELAERFGCMVLVDEAHGTGVLGPSGAGALEHFALRTPLVQVGTLSKALGTVGGYVCGSAPLIEYLRHRTRTWIYTTGTTPADTAAALAAVGIAREEADRRARLWRNIEQLRTGLARLGIAHLPSDAAIFCLPTGDIASTLEVSRRLLAAGIFAPAIRPPTVPTSRIRLSLMATHTPEMIDRLLDALGGCPLVGE